MLDEIDTGWKQMQHTHSCTQTRAHSYDTHKRNGNETTSTTKIALENVSKGGAERNDREYVFVGHTREKNREYCEEIEKKQQRLLSSVSVYSTRARDKLTNVIGSLFLSHRSLYIARF